MTDLYLPNSVKSNGKLSRSDIAFQKLKKFGEKYTKKKIVPIQETVLLGSDQDMNHLTDSDQGTRCTKPTESEEIVTVLSILKHKHNIEETSVEKPIINYCYSSANLSSLDVSKTSQSSFQDSTSGNTATMSQMPHHEDENTLPYSEKTTEKNNFTCVSDDDTNDILTYDSKCEERNNIKCNIMLSLGTTDDDQSEWSSKSRIGSEKNISHNISQHTNIPQVNQSLPLETDRDDLTSGLESIKTEIADPSNKNSSQEFPVEISNLACSDTAEESETQNSFIAEDQASSSTNNQTFLCENEQNMTSSLQEFQIGSKSLEKKLLCIKCNKILEKENKSLGTETNNKFNDEATQTTGGANILHSPYFIQPPVTSSAETANQVSQDLSLYKYLILPTSDKGISRNDPATNMLNKMLLAQVNLTQHFIRSQYAMYQAHCVSVRTLSNSYQPVTLENTKKFIKQSKKMKRSRGLSS